MYPIEALQQELFDFEKLLNHHGLQIKSNSDLEKVSIKIIEALLSDSKDFYLGLSIKLNSMEVHCYGLIIQLNFDFLPQSIHCY